MGDRVERTFATALQAQELPGGAWRLSSGGAQGSDIMLRPVDPEGRALLEGGNATRAVIEWRPGGAEVTLTIARVPQRLRVRTVILHEPRPALYDALPLVKLDAAARRFWRRVFWLVRVPGGRRLLGLVARRAGGSR